MVNPWGYMYKNTMIWEIVMLAAGSREENLYDVILEIFTAAVNFITSLSSDLLGNFRQGL